MISFLIVSYLLSITHSQCSNSHSQSLLFSVSINGNHIDKIGQDTYLSIVESSARAIVPSGATKIGINTFGGITGETATTTTKLTMASTTWTTVQSTIQGLSSEDFDANWGNSVSGAVKTALFTTWDGQKYHIIFSAGMPLANGYGDTTNPINFDDPCTNSITAKQNNIQQYVVLIGQQGTHYIREYFLCMVEDPDNDIIEINPLSVAAGIASLQSRVCKTNGIDIKITEINPVDSTYRPFIEVLNRGAPASISVCWANNACSTPTTVATGAYYVGYGQGNGAIPTAGTVQDSLGANTNGATGWIAKAQVNGSNVTHIAHDIYWQALIAGSSYELRGVGYNNAYGANWRMSCYPNQGGTPGYAPVDCQELDNSCSQINCELNGASSTGCVGVSHSESLCQCPSTYLEDIHSCIQIPEVKGGCIVYVVPDEKTQKDFTYFTWNRVQWDGMVSYDVLYPTLHAIGYWNAGGVAAASRNDAHPSIITGDVSPNISIIARYKSPIRGTSASSTTEVTCNVQTLAPVINPTASPTVLPTTTETTFPTESTPAPTVYESGVFISDICAPSRCECFGKALSCCKPFGPWEDPLNLTSGYVPSHGCNHLFQTIEIETYHRIHGLNQSIMVQQSGDSGRVEVKYTIYNYGVVNQSAFEDLAEWTHYYAASSNNHSHILQNLSASTLQQGNVLNIDVKPPGNNGKKSGMIVIEDGDKNGELSLNILTSTLKCTKGDCPVTYDECKKQGVAFQLVIDSCSSTASTECGALYPYVLWLMVYRSHQLCRIEIPLPDTKDNDVPSWIWWGLLSLILFMVCLTILVYRFWLQHRDLTDAVADTQHELVEQVNNNDAGFYRDLDRGDVVFNTLATAVPGHHVPGDPFGNELHQRREEQQNEMAHVDTHTFVVRQPYAPISTKPRKESNQ